ncbi:hypothetical protein J7U46_00020 [Pelomonas sp. V22]|uniref:hypothetical protein n=1 Tax=Pelomonas sp. V22 TaxID=2822139 RepID=UPI0024A9499C|nr:hypothetical protein [Pelomonas sp. V22]MDI4631426.1 hypothetical protein [Pelomonas sp. V22]
MARPSPSSPTGANGKPTVRVLSRGERASAELSRYTAAVPGEAAPVATGLAAANEALRREASSLAQKTTPPTTPPSGLGVRPGALSGTSPLGALTGHITCNGVDYPVGRNSSAVLDRPSVASLKQSRVAPGGALLLQGRCFGKAPGQVRLVGGFPGGALVLTPSIWQHDTVFVDIPSTAQSQSPDVLVQLIDAQGRQGTQQRVAWEAPAQKMQRMEVDSAKVWEVAQCQFPGISGGQCNGVNRVKNYGWMREGGLLDRPWVPQPGELSAHHLLYNHDKPVAPFRGRDTYTLRAPAGCTVDRTYGGQVSGAALEEAPISSAIVSHPDGRSMVVDWTANYCLEVGWALDHDWQCEAVFASRKTVLNCPAGTSLLP